MKRTLSLLLLFTLSVATLNLVTAESTVTFNSDSITLRIISPENITYQSSIIQVTISAQANPAVVNVAYSLDGGNLTYILRGNLAHIFNDTFMIAGLEEGIHRLDVQADTFAQNSNGYITAKSSVTFSITTKTVPTPTIAPTTAPTNYPTISPTPTVEPTESSQVNQPVVIDHYQATLIAVASVIIILAVASVSVVYLRRRKT